MAHLLRGPNGHLMRGPNGHLAKAAATCCFYQLWTCPDDETSVAVDKWVSAATYAPGDVLSDDGGVTWYHIPLDAVASLCPGTIVTITDVGTVDDCAGAGGFDCMRCEPCCWSTVAYVVTSWTLSSVTWNGDPPAGVTVPDNILFADAVQIPFSPGDCFFDTGIGSPRYTALYGWEVDESFTDPDGNVWSLSIPMETGANCCGGSVTAGSALITMSPFGGGGSRSASATVTGTVAVQNNKCCTDGSGDCFPTVADNCPDDASCEDLESP